MSSKDPEIQKWKNILKADIFDELRASLLTKNSYKRQWAKDEANTITKSVDHFRGRFPDEDIKVYTDFVSYISFRIFSEPELQTINPDYLEAKRFRSFYEFNLAELNLYRLIQNPNESLIQQLESLNDHPEQKERVYKDLLEHYKQCEKIVLAQGLIKSNNDLDGVFRFELKELGTYHWRKHSIQDVYQDDFKKQAFNQICKEMISPEKYHQEAIFVINNFRPDGDGNYLELFTDNIEYKEHNRFVSVDEKRKVLVTYFKKEINSKLNK